jgi:DNA repair protein RadC
MKPNSTHDLFTVCEIDILYRNKVKATDRPQITDYEAAAALLRQAWDANKLELVEQFRILLVDRKNRCLGISHCGD